MIDLTGLPKRYQDLEMGYWLPRVPCNVEIFASLIAGGTIFSEVSKAALLRRMGRGALVVDRSAFQFPAGHLGPPAATGRECRKCHAKTVRVQIWESACGAFEDSKYTCACGDVLWVDGGDS